MLPLSLLDPERPQIAGRPTWAEAPNIVVPTLQLSLEEEGQWRVQFMFPDRTRRNSFGWISWRADDEGELLDFLRDWEASPEETVRKYFHEEPPKGRVWNVEARSAVTVLTEEQAEELGL